MEKDTQQSTQGPESGTEPPQSARPDEVGTVQVDAFVRIFDPHSQQTFLETRA